MRIILAYLLGVFSIAISIPISLIIGMCISLILSDLENFFGVSLGYESGSIMVLMPIFVIFILAMLCWSIVVLLHNKNLTRHILCIYPLKIIYELYLLNYVIGNLEEGYCEWTFVVMDAYLLFGIYIVHKIMDRYYLEGDA